MKLKVITSQEEYDDEGSIIRTIYECPCSNGTVIEIKGKSLSKKGWSGCRNIFWNCPQCSDEYNLLSLVKDKY